MGPSFNCYTHSYLFFPDCACPSSSPASLRIDLPAADPASIFSAERICVLTKTWFAFSLNDFIYCWRFAVLDWGSGSFVSFHEIIFFLYCSQDVCTGSRLLRPLTYTFRKQPVTEDVLVDNDWMDVRLCLSARPSERINLCVWFRGVFLFHHGFFLFRHVIGNIFNQYFFA